MQIYLQVFCNNDNRAAGEKVEAFFCNFENFKSIGEKICILFTNKVKIMYFTPFFYPL